MTLAVAEKLRRKVMIEHREEECSRRWMLREVYFLWIGNEPTALVISVGRVTPMTLAIVINVGGCYRC